MSLVQPEAAQHGIDFSPGFLDTPDRLTLPPGATPEARNAFLYRIETAAGKVRATMGKRPGHKLLTAAAALTSSGARRGLHEFRREADPRQLLAKNGTAWARYEAGAWVTISGAFGYANDRVGRIGVLKNEAVFHDGTKQQIYDGTAVRPVGFARPTGVTNMTAGAGPGPTGTFTARYTWYDQTHAHESSPTTAATAPLAITNQSRVHTKPSGSPPANVTHWRIYVRREDIYERYWMYVGQEAVATATFTEAILDAARRSRMPEDYENEPPSVVFHILESWNGFGIGFAAGSSTMHVSKQGDLESWDPSHVFTGVLTQGGDLVTSALNFGTEFLIQKPTQSFHLIGDRLPFRVEDLQSGFGNLSQESAMEVEGLFYAWDRDQGPYRTDLGSRWEPLAQGRIEKLLFTAQTGEVRIAHDRKHSLVCWTVQTSAGGSSGLGTGNPTTNTILAYNYRLNCWYPPMTGAFLMAMTWFGTSGIHAINEEGHLFQLFTDGLARDQVPSGTVKGRWTTANVTTCTDTTASFYLPTPDALRGCRVGTRPVGSGEWQWATVLYNTSTSISTNWGGQPVPQAGWEYVIGGIDFLWWTPPFDAGQINIKKRGGWLTVQQGAPPVNTGGWGLEDRYGPDLLVPGAHLDVAVRLDAEWAPGIERTLTVPSTPYVYSGTSLPVLFAGDLPGYDQWTALGGGAKYLEVDDPIGTLALPGHDADASYIATTVPGAQQGFRAGPIALPSDAYGIVVGVKGYAWTNGTGSTLAWFLLINGVLYGIGSAGVAQVWNYTSASSMTNPVSNIGWRPRELAEGLGVVVQGGFTGTGTESRISQVWLDIGYTRKPPTGTLKKRIHRSFYEAQLRFQNPYPDELTEIRQYRLDADLLPRRSVRSAP